MTTGTPNNPGSGTLGSASLIAASGHMAYPRARKNGLPVTTPRVHIATDHAGMELSAHLVSHLTAKGYEVVDHGPKEYDALDDYPSFCINAGAAVVADQEAGVHALGIVLGGSGNGEQIAANKVKGVRAALAWNLSTAKLAREHNDANVVAVGGRQHSVEEATELIEAFLQEPFSNDERHVRRIGKIAVYETTGEIVE
ncbi:ribose 5-phosphate isomerase B [Arthrobacter sp. yr096]|nr:ribose 5-phosphate isomerase B [Arthrobacter sp. yr096]